MTLTHYSSEIYRDVANRTGITVAEARRIILNYQQSIEEKVAKGQNVTMIGHGKFYRTLLRARKYRSRKWPWRTIVHPAIYIARFKPGAAFRRRVAKTKPPVEES